MNHIHHIKKGSFTRKDIAVVIVSVLVLVGLILLIVYTRKREMLKQQDLSQISENMQEDANGARQQSLLVINEVNQRGWVELYNSSNQNESVKGDSIWFNGQKVIEITEDQQVAKKSFLVLDMNKTIGESGHDLITLKNEAQEEIQTVLVPQLMDDLSYGYRKEGSIEAGIMTATRGGSNADAQEKAAQSLTFSVPGGFYSGEFELSLTAPEGAKIYYTTDGTTPTSESQLYEGQFKISNVSGNNYVYAASEGGGYASEYRPSSIDQGTVVKAMMVDSSGRQSEIFSQSYYVGLESKGEYQDIPVISISPDPGDLFNYFSGIYVLGRTYEDAIAGGATKTEAANYRNDWLKDAHVEYYEPNKNKSYEGEAKIETIKDFSVTSAQKSLRLSNLNTEGWNGSSLFTYLRNNKTVLTLQTGRRDNNYQIREYLIHDLLKNTSVGVADLMPCHLFLEGEYWGIYMLRSDYDADYLARHYGVTHPSVLVKNGTSSDYDHRNLYTDFYKYVTTTDLGKNENYSKVEGYMDMQSYLDYFCANMFLSNADYGVDEPVIWRTIENGTGYEDGKWRWMIGKMDNSMDNGMVSKLTTSSIDSYLQKSVTEDPFLKSLLKNDKFRKQLSETMATMANDVFSEDKVEQELNTISDRMQKAILTNRKRFFSAVQENYYTSEMNKIETFTNERRKYIITYTNELTNQTGN